MQTHALAVFKRSKVNHVPICHVAFEHARIGGVDILDCWRTGGLVIWDFICITRIDPKRQRRYRWLLRLCVIVAKFIS